MSSSAFCSNIPKEKMELAVGKELFETGPASSQVRTSQIEHARRHPFRSSARSLRRFTDRMLFHTEQFSATVTLLVFLNSVTICSLQEFFENNHLNHPIRFGVRTENSKRACVVKQASDRSPTINRLTKRTSPSHPLELALFLFDENHHPDTFAVLQW